MMSSSGLSQEIEPSFPSIPGVDTVKGISMTGGTIPAYRQVLSMFQKDAKERLQLLRFFIIESLSSGKFSPKHIPSFTTQVHALRSASATMGAADLSAQAARLEEASIAGNMDYILEKLPDFTELLAELVDNIQKVLELPLTNGKTKDAPADQSPGPEHPLFSELDSALKSQKITEIERILSELSSKPLDGKTAEILEQISDQILMTEFNGALSILENFTGHSS